MDSSEHQNLTNVIKGVHQKLRKAVNSSCDPDKVWDEHLQDHEIRKNYSECMYKLATEIWKGKESRIEWTYKTCLDYFFNGGLEHSLIRQMKIEKTKFEKENKDGSLFENIKDVALHNSYEKLNRRLKLLDVGSCYNPFSKFEEFECTAIDLTPATNDYVFLKITLNIVNFSNVSFSHCGTQRVKDVLQYDFLSSEITPKADTNSSNNISHVFVEEKYDVVVLSLVLEYLPSAKQRTVFCYKSWQLLQENGLCIIITPDSKSVNHNAHMMKSWKLAMEKLGFLRIKYEKLQHIHCMAFRKLKNKAEVSDWEYISELLYIPQDFVLYTEKEETVVERTEQENSQIYSIFSELPGEEAF